MSAPTTSDDEAITVGWRTGRAAGRSLAPWVVPTFLLPALLVVATSVATWSWGLRGDWADYAASTSTPFTYWRYEVWALTLALAAGPLVLVLGAVVLVVRRLLLRAVARDTPLVLDRTGLHHRPGPGGKTELVRWKQITSVQVVHDDGPRLAVHVKDPQRLVVPQRGEREAAEARSRIAQHGTPLLLDLTRLAVSAEELVEAFGRFGVRATTADSGAGETLHAARPWHHTVRRTALAVVGWTLPVAASLVLAVLLTAVIADLDSLVTGSVTGDWLVAFLCLLVVGVGWLTHGREAMPHHRLGPGPAAVVDASGFRERTSAVDVGRVRWAEVLGLRLDQQDGARLLVVRLRDPREVAARATTSVRRMYSGDAEAAAREQHERHGSPVVIRLDQVADPDRLVEAFQQHSGHQVVDAYSSRSAKASSASRTNAAPSPPP